VFGEAHIGRQQAQKLMKQHSYIKEVRKKKREVI
jgi:ribosomal protein S2